MKNIILADDDEIFIKIMTRHLHSWGFNVIANTNGRNVLQQIKDFKPVACIIDMVMPEKEGMETIFEISEIENRPIIIGISATQTYLSIVSDIVVDATLLKPVTPEKLKATLDKLGITL